MSFSRQRLVFFVPRYHTNMIPWIKGLKAGGVTVDVVSIYAGKTESYQEITPRVLGVSRLSRMLIKVGCRLLKMSEFNSTLYFGFPSIRKLRKEITSIAPDISVIRPPLSMFGIIVSCLSLMERSKIIFYTQGNLYEKHYSRKNQKIIDGLISVFRAAWITPVLGDTKGQKKHHKMYYFPFAMEVKNDRPRQSIKQILCVGKFEQRKNHHLLLQAISGLKEQYAFHVKLVGEASSKEHEQYLQSIYRMIDQLGLQNHVSVLTNIPFVEMHEIYRETDLFVLPSSNESASVSQLEAMAFGCPVICSDDNGTRFYVEPGRTGYWMKKNDPEDLMRCLEALLSDPEKVQQFSKNCLETLKEVHDPVVLGHKLLEIAQGGKR